MNWQSLHSRIITGNSIICKAVQFLLLFPTLLYRLAVRIRNNRFDRKPSLISKVSAPVISIGNITSGGTGKTPLVIDFLERFSHSEAHPAVVSRGYKSAPGQAADELRLVWRHLPDAICVANPDRVAGANDAIQTQNANLILLDDGFQHRRIHRDLDVVVIDATCPFGHGHLLPRGLLREPLSSLRRASLIVLSRIDQVASTEGIIEEIRRYAPTTPVLRCSHSPLGLYDIEGNAHIQPGKAYVFAGIGNPRAFEKTLQEFKTSISGTRWFRDHHNYTQADLFSLERAARNTGAEYLLTTEKDIVKLTQCSDKIRIPLLALRIQIEFLEDDSSRLNQLLAPILNELSDSQDSRSTGKREQT